MSMVVLAVLSTVTFLRTFTQQRTVFEREARGGMSITGYFLANTAVDTVWLVLVSIACAGISRFVPKRIECPKKYL
jgi:Trk-type K+ transport system membrane component